MANGGMLQVRNVTSQSLAKWDSNYEIQWVFHQCYVKIIFDIDIGFGFP